MRVTAGTSTHSGGWSLTSSTCGALRVNVVSLSGPGAHLDNDGGLGRVSLARTGSVPGLNNNLNKKINRKSILLVLWMEITKIRAQMY